MKERKQGKREIRGGKTLPIISSSLGSEEAKGRKSSRPV